MIRVTKPSRPNALLAGARRTATDCAAYDEHGDEYSNGVKRFDFDRVIYGHTEVRTALREAQQCKCCYCEGRFDAFATLDVEHYRPKGAVRQESGSPEQLPGYYWLAYSWENLYLCCPICNRRGKKDLFPLADDSARARSHRDDIARESPLLLDPGGPEDPRAHVRFQQERAVGLTRAGRRTIEVLDLNRPPLIEERRRCLRRLRELQVVQRLDADGLEPAVIELRERARRELARAPSPSAIFSAMAADFLRESGAVGDEAEAP